jgi:SAM-dependent methyltransferase
MPATAVLRASALALLVGISSVGLAQATREAPASSTYTPMVGQEGKDVVWVPTPQALVDKMLDMAHVTAQDIVMDLGSGDGRTVITAAKRGAHATGIEYNPDMVALSKANAAKAGVSDRAKFLKADLFKTDLSKATVITMFLLPDINLKLRPKLLALKPGTRVVSNTFTMGDWKPDETGSPKNCDGSWCTALLWIVPARVSGSYQTPRGEVTLKQHYQMLSGTLRADGRTVPLEGRVRGEEVSFTAGGKQYRGRLKGHSLELN